MSLAAKLWIGFHVQRRRIRLRLRGAPEPRRERFVRESAAHKSFVDVGGLYRIDGKVAFMAEEAGAQRVTLVDVSDPTRFQARKDEVNSSIRFVQGDIEDPETIDRIGVHDIVYCCGVIYHTPNPVAQLMQLRRITGELLYLGTHTIPEVPGLEQACVFYPYLPESARQTYSTAHFRPEEIVGIGRPFVDRPMRGHANFWFGITPSALRAMLRTARFEVVEEVPAARSPFFTEVIAKPVDGDPVMPPVDYFRQRGDARLRGENVPFDDYYDWARKQK